MVVWSSQKSSARPLLISPLRVTMRHARPTGHVLVGSASVAGSYVHAVPIFEKSTPPPPGPASSPTGVKVPPPFWQAAPPSAATVTARPKTRATLEMRDVMRGVYRKKSAAEASEKSGGALARPPRQPSWVPCADQRSGHAVS